MTKIAFLFLTIDIVKHNKIWEDYFKHHTSKYSIYIHPKYPDKVSIPWMKNNIISNLVPTKWGYLTNAFYQLLYTAYQDKDNTHFFFVSDSCIPISSFSLFYKYIYSFHKNTSFIHFKSVNIDYELSKRFYKREDKSNIKKHEGLGNCLSRFHAHILLFDKKKEFSSFHSIHCGDEHYLSIIYNIEPIEDIQLTYYNWDEIPDKLEVLNKQLRKWYEKQEKTKKKNPLFKKKIDSLRKKKSDIGKHPKTYNIMDITPEIKKKLLKKNYFFMRKIDNQYIE